MGYTHHIEGNCSISGGGGPSGPTTGVETFNLADLPLNSNGCTIPIQIENNGEGRIEFCLDGADGNVVVCFEQSVDGNKYFPFNECSSFVLDQDTQVIIGKMTSLFYRVCVKESNECHTATVGTLKSIILVNNE